MSEELSSFVLQSRDGADPAPVLAGVSAAGRLDGVLFELTLRQTYRNGGRRPLEVVYTFPLPHQAVLTGFASELNGSRQVGTMVARPDAERTYEKGLAAGDAPVMLEASGDGLHTANIGNLKPGDELVLEVRYAQLLAFEHDRLRLAIPTTIAPRYGDAGRAGLQPQQVPTASITAEYPLALSVTVAGSLASASVECPTHRVLRESAPGSLTLKLDPAARLDRDVVLLVKPREPLPSLVVHARDTVPGAAPVVVLAAFQPPVTQTVERVALKLLVDCSGSMGGDSIASARAALRGALAGLGPHDYVSLTRFGNSVEQAVAPGPCTPQGLARLEQAVKALEADLGGTEMEAALRAVFALRSEVPAADVLLLTDGEIWQTEEAIAAALKSRHRVFVIGVGSSPAEGVLRKLAEATGGACEFATPGEALELAARRMMERIRQRPWSRVRVDWGAEPIWQSELPLGVFGGDTVLALAGLRTAPATTGVRLLASDDREVEAEIARGAAGAPAVGDTLARIAAARRMVLADEPTALKLGLAYQLMGQQTHCILVHERAAADKVTEEAELHRVASMMAAGWGGTSTVIDDHIMFSRCLASAADECLIAPSVSSSQSFGGIFGEDGSLGGGLLGGHSRSMQAERAEPVFEDTLEGMARTVAHHLALGEALNELPAVCQHFGALDAVREAIEQITAMGVSLGAAWLLLAHWVNVRSQGLADATVAEALRPHIEQLSPSLIADSPALFESLLGMHPNDRWAPSRQARLRRAMKA